MRVLLPRNNGLAACQPTLHFASPAAGARCLVREILLVCVERPLPRTGFPIVCLLQVLRDRERGAFDGRHPSRALLSRVARELDGGEDRIGDEELMDSQLKAVAEQLGFRASIKDGLAENRLAQRGA